MVVMDSLKNARRKRMNDNAVKFQDVNPAELLPYLMCLPRQKKERIFSKQRNDGPSDAAQMLGMELVKVDNWFEQLIPALRELSQNDLANLLDDPCPQKDNRPQEDTRLEMKGKFSPHQYKNLRHSEVQSTLPQPSTALGQSSKVTPQTLYIELSATILNVLRRLDVPTPASSSDWKGLAGQLGYNIDFVQRVAFQQGITSFTEALLHNWSMEGDATLERLVEALHSIHRVDICQQLEELLGLRFQSRSNTQASNTVEPESKLDVGRLPRAQLSAEQDGKSELAAKPQITNAASEKPVIEEEVEPDEEQASSQQPVDVPSHEEKSIEDVTTKSENVTEKEPDPSPKPQNNPSIETSKAGKFEQDIGSEKQNMSDENRPQDEVPSAQSICKDSQLPVNNLNRKRLGTNPNNARSGEIADANCQGKTLLSNDPETCSDNNPGDACDACYVESNPDGYYSLHTEESLIQNGGSLQFSDASVPSLPGASAGDDLASSSTVTSSTVTSSATTFPSANTTPLTPPTVDQAVKKDTPDGFTPTVQILTSSLNKPIRQPSESPKYLPDQFQMPSVDGAFTEEALMRATISKSTSLQVSEPVQQQLRDAEPAAEQVGTKPSQPTPQPDKDIQDLSPKTNHLERIGELQKEQASHAEHQAQTTSFPTSLPSQDDDDDSGGSPELSVIKKQESPRGTQLDPPPVPQLVESTGLLPTTEPPTISQASPHTSRKEVDSADSPQDSGTKSPKASQQEVSLPDQDNIQPSRDDTEDQEDDSQEPDAEIENTDVATESQGRRALVGVALAVPVVLSLAALFRGGDILSNAL